MKPTKNGEKKIKTKKEHTFSFLQSILTAFFSFELSGLLDFYNS